MVIFSQIGWAVPDYGRHCEGMTGAGYYRENSAAGLSKMSTLLLPCILLLNFRLLGKMKE